MSKLSIGEFRRGWRPLLAAVVGMAFGLSAVPYYSISSFMAPLHAEFGWSVNAIGLAGAIVSAGNFFTGPFVGRFWLIAVGASIYSLAIGAVMLHLQPILKEIGWTGTGAAGAASMLGIGIILGRFLAGSLLDRFHGPRVALALFCLPAIGYLILYSQWAALAPLAVLIVGLSVGVEGDTISYFTARYFGLRSYSELFGWMFGFMCLAGAAGPLLVIALKVGEGYQTALLVFSAQSVLAALLLGLLGKYPVWGANAAA